MKFYNYEIFGIVILPEHFHMVLKPENICDYPKIFQELSIIFQEILIFSRKHFS